MNLDKFEKIDGREALKRLADGENVFSKAGVEYKLNQYGFIYYLDDDMNDWKTSRIAFNQLIVQGFYIPKPFDVRQAMIERPNEWVGAFEDRKGEWHKVGFDTESFMAIETGYDSTVKCEFYAYNVRQATEKEMYACIPIEDVPEEATR